MFFDAHCHLTQSMERRESKLAFAMCCSGTSSADWPFIRQAARLHDHLLPSYGLHPWNVHSKHRASLELSVLVEYLSENPMALIGECGMDAVRNHATLELQSSVFAQQLHLAKHHNRPVVIHCVRAWGALLRELEKAAPFSHPVVLHAYSGSPELVRTLCRYPAYFSVQGMASGHSRRPKTEKCLQCIPENRLLLETDCDLAETSSDDQYKRLIQTAEWVADSLGKSVEELIRITCENAIRCYRLPLTSIPSGSSSLNKSVDR